MKRHHNDYRENLLEALKDCDEALAYLNAALRDEDQRVFLLALKDVLTAQGAEISALAGKAHLTRQNIYRMLSKTGNPRWNSLSALLNAIGYNIKLSERHSKPVADLPPIDVELYKYLEMQAQKLGITLHELVNKKLSCT